METSIRVYANLFIPVSTTISLLGGKLSKVATIISLRSGLLQRIQKNIRTKGTNLGFITRILDILDLDEE